MRETFADFHVPGLVTACLSATCLAVSALFAAAGAQGHSGAVFGKWHTFCDKELLCAAYTYSGTDGNPQSGHLFTLERKKDGVDWAMSITLDRIEPKLSLGVMPSVIRYGHDGSPISHFTEETLRLFDDSPVPGTAKSYKLLFSGPSAEAVMERLRLGDILNFEFGGCREEFLYADFSLDGVTAALQWIDRKQGQEASSRISDGPVQSGPEVVKNCDGGPKG